MTSSKRDPILSKFQSGLFIVGLITLVLSTASLRQFHSEIVGLFAKQLFSKSLVCVELLMSLTQTLCQET